MTQVLLLAISIPAILVAATAHEFARALTSSFLGDTLPKKEGRLTLNPLKHFEPVGFLLMFATGFGWGKPVNTSALYYKNRKTGTLLTAVVPSVVNLLLAALCFFCYRVFDNGPVYTPFGLLSYFFYRSAFYNITLFAYNLAPVSPMDCIKVLSALMPANTYFRFLQYEKVIQVLFLLALFMGWTDFIFNPIIGFCMTSLQTIIGI